MGARGSGCRARVGIFGAAVAAKHLVAGETLSAIIGSSFDAPAHRTGMRALTGIWTSIRPNISSCLCRGISRKIVALPESIEAGWRGLGLNWSWHWYGRTALETPFFLVFKANFSL